MTDTETPTYFEIHLVTGGPRHLGSVDLDLRTWCGVMFLRKSSVKTGEVSKIDCKLCRKRAAYRYALLEKR